LGHGKQRGQAYTNGVNGSESYGIRPRKREARSEKIRSGESGFTRHVGQSQRRSEATEAMLRRIGKVTRFDGDDSPVRMTCVIWEQGTMMEG
jgi:hypothetical protein